MIAFLKNIVSERNVDAFTDLQDPFICLWDSPEPPDNHLVEQLDKYIGRHPEHDVYHVNLKGEPAFPRTAKAGKFFRLVFMQGRLVPLASFVFRTAVFRSKAVFRADGSLDALATVMACAKDRPIRTPWLLKMSCPPATAPDGAAAEAHVWERIELYRWTEVFFGDDDYPVGAGERMALFAAQVAKLYPGRTEEELKGVMANFQVTQGPIRKMRAAQALKKALANRKKDLTEWR